MAMLLIFPPVPSVHIAIAVVHTAHTMLQVVLPCACSSLMLMADVALRTEPAVAYQVYLRQLQMLYVHAAPLSNFFGCLKSTVFSYINLAPCAGVGMCSDLLARALVAFVDSVNLTHMDTMM